MNDNERQATARSAALSMRDRASRAALRRGVVPCAWLANEISRDIESLPLLEELDMPDQPNQSQQAQQGQQGQQLSGAAQSLKSACPPDVVARVDAAGVDWNRLADLVAQMLPLLLALFGK
jgi:hypothetical protein